MKKTYLIRSILYGDTYWDKKMKFFMPVKSINNYKEILSLGFNTEEAALYCVEHELEIDEKYPIEIVKVYYK